MRRPHTRGAIYYERKLLKYQIYVGKLEICLCSEDEVPGLVWSRRHDIETTTPQISRHHNIQPNHNIPQPNYHLNTYLNQTTTYLNEITTYLNEITTSPETSYLNQITTLQHQHTPNKSSRLRHAPYGLTRFDVQCTNDRKMRPNCGALFLPILFPGILLLLPPFSTGIALHFANDPTVLIGR